MSTFSTICQFKITLNGIEPKIWRCIQVPNYYTFEDLHLAIQDAMGWENCNSYVFSIKNPETGEVDEIIPEDEEDELVEGVIHDDEVELSKYFTSIGSVAQYEYDFDDGWEHEVMLEKILPMEDYVDYPKCIDGARACPPENCGGVSTYEDMVKILKDPKHKKYKEIIDCFGNFDPEEFDPKAVSFCFFNDFLFEEEEEENQ